MTSLLKVRCDQIAGISAPAVTSARTVAPPSGAVRSRYLPGLDGLRAVAVVAVLLYHADVSWLPGGFLGVDVFFVISGYLITMLLLEEHHRSGTIGVRRFYGRRARRLLPALYLLLATTCVVVVLFFRDEAAKLRPQVLSALTYSTNWYLIATDGSYFQQLGRPLLLRHLWSLAVEEQFYLLWPLVLVVLLRRFRGRLGPIALAVAGVTAASAVWMAVLYQPGQDPSRLYYGTDTRISTHPHGRPARALLAAVRAGPRRGPPARTPLRRHRRRRAGRRPPVLPPLDGHRRQPLPRRLRRASPRCPRWPWPRPPTRAPTSARPSGAGALTWIGVRSYALYLWHWPIFVLTRPDLDVPLSGWPLLVLRLGLTVVLADLSYRLVERPIRRIGLRSWVRRTVSIGPPGRRRPVAAAVVLGTVVAAGGVAVVMRAGKPPVSDIEQSLRAGQEAIASAPTATEPVSTIAVTLPASKHGDGGRRHGGAVHDGRPSARPHRPSPPRCRRRRPLRPRRPPHHRRRRPPVRSSPSGTR